MNFYLPTIAKVVDDSNLNKTHIEKALYNNEPIIVGYHPGISPPFVIIDGNHRVASKINMGENYVLGYLLKPTMHLKCMATKLDQALYLTHHNLINHLRELNKEPLLNPEFNDGILSF